MKYGYFFICIFLSIPILSIAYTWQNVGPTDIEANNFYVWGGGITYEIICTSDGMLVNINGNCEEFSYGNLPIWDVEAVVLAIADLLVVMGDGSYSDGIYMFNFSNYEFMISQYFVNPRFIGFFPGDAHFYAGGEQGLLRSETGTVWNVVDYFDGKSCYDMVSYENNYVVSTDEGVFYSSDSGTNWSPADTLIFLSDLVYSYSGILYGIFPEQAWNSGLWSSIDQGASWTREFWSFNMSSVGFDCDQNLFVGWEEAYEEHEGIAIWHPDIWDLSFYNEGLGNTNINAIMVHPLLNCINMLCCTDGGVYFLTNYYTASDQVTFPESYLELNNYPNPFNPTTTISFQLSGNSSQEDLELSIYNIKGQIVKTLPIPLSLDPTFSVVWDGTDQYMQTVTSGIYFYKLKARDFEQTKKMILMK